MANLIPTVPVSTTSHTSSVLSSSSAIVPAPIQLTSSSNAAAHPPGPPTSSSNAAIRPPTSSSSAVITTSEPSLTSSPAGQTDPSSQISSSTAAASTSSNVTGPAQQLNDHHLSDSAVAGVAIGAAVGLALATFLLTFLFMRSRRTGRDSRRRQPGAAVPSSMDPSAFQDTDLELKQPVTTERSVAARAPGSLETYLPQSADDNAVKIKVATLLEQIQLHVENFYHNSTASNSEASAVELTKFDSPELPEPLRISMRQPRRQIPSITHCLTRSIVSSIMPDTDPEQSLLPPDFVALPNAIKLCKFSKPRKPGFDEACARWRVLSAYIRPNPAEDTRYISHRDRIIGEVIQTFSHAFTPWQNPRYRDGERVRSLTEIMKSAADLGIWLFSQPSTFQFQWRGQEKSGTNAIVVAPALVKVASERAQPLSKAQVMVEMIIQKI